MITCETTETTNLRTAYLIHQYPFELFTQHLPLYPPPITRLSALPEHHWRRANFFVFLALALALHYCTTPGVEVHNFFLGKAAQLGGAYHGSRPCWALDE
jgi:hypothetical protein